MAVYAKSLTEAPIAQKIWSNINLNKLCIRRQINTENFILAWFSWKFSQWLDEWKYQIPQRSNFNKKNFSLTEFFGNVANGGESWNKSKQNFRMQTKSFKLYWWGCLVLWDFCLFHRCFMLKLGKGLGAFVKFLCYQVFEVYAEENFEWNCYWGVKLNECSKYSIELFFLLLKDFLFPQSCKRLDPKGVNNIFNYVQVFSVSKLILLSLFSSLKVPKTLFTLITRERKICQNKSEIRKKVSLQRICFCPT